MSGLERIVSKLKTLKKQMPSTKKVVSVIHFDDTGNLFVQVICDGVMTIAPVVFEQGRYVVPSMPDVAIARGVLRVPVPMCEAEWQANQMLLNP